MKLIPSRKGFDSAAGRGPSPILPDGRLLSLPIPEPSDHPGAGTRYDEISATGDLSMSEVITQLGLRRPDPTRGAHLDPDLDARALPRDPEWRPIFGQSHAAQTHLDNNGVGVGDLFIFFGLFRRTTGIGGSLRWATGSPRVHAPFGWLQVGAQHRVTPSLDLPWAAAHPHLRDPMRTSNTVYVASDELSFAPHLRGAGLIRWNTRACRTAPGAQTTSWPLPACFEPSPDRQTLSYHDRLDRWERRVDGTVGLQAVARGQELVTDLDDRMLHEWVLPLIEANAAE